MRDWIDNHQGIIGVGSAVVIVVALLWMWLGGDSETRTPEDEAWYFDAVEQEAFTAPSRQIPPIESPWGNDAVRVFYFSCGECTIEERFAGFYMKYNAETKAKLEADENLKASAFGESFPGRMYSADGVNWVEAPNISASGVTAKLGERCFGKLRSCR